MSTNAGDGGARRSAQSPAAPAQDSISFKGEATHAAAEWLAPVYNALPPGGIAAVTNTATPGTVRNELEPNYDAVRRGIREAAAHPRRVRSWLAKTMSISLATIAVTAILAVGILGFFERETDQVYALVGDIWKSILPLVAAIIGFYFGAGSSGSVSADQDDEAKG
ncbi:MAG: hypothetical protein LBE08_09605 [Bifidobacteriaceae bacterium]|jgi:hypothetical protein|nr:hypothetical protein [Bifidobacteriaceae bacterium]